MKIWILILLVTLAVLVFSSGCGKLPTKEAGAQFPAVETKGDTRLSNIFSGVSEHRNGKSGFLLLRDGTRAFTERLHLADSAQRSIDAQYYIWNSDKTGKLLMQRLLEAAERGVAVRLLLDDFSVGDRNEELLTINSHPNIQVRIYNPFIVRSGIGKWFNFAADFDRLNRRSHNKTFTMDQTVAIVGGRNIGDEYFDQNDHINFSDVDLLSVGPVVDQVVESFAEYWDSPWAVPINQLLEQDDEEPQYVIIRKFLAADLHTPLLLPFPESSGKLEAHFVRVLSELVWAPSVFLADKPGGTTDQAYSDEPKRVARKLLELAADSRREILIESAYFVLTHEALVLAAELRDNGVRIRALTNSMSSNDVLPNHASYAMVRADMLDHGIELHELRPDASSCVELIGRKEYCDEDSHLGLHAKAAVFDRETVYIGSMNLNLRSAYLNTEAAMIVQSPLLAQELSEQIEMNMVPENSWQAVKQDGILKWVTENDGREDVSVHEPMTSWLDRVKAGFLTLVPGALYY